MEFNLENAALFLSIVLVHVGRGAGWAIEKELT